MLLTHVSGMRIGVAFFAKKTPTKNNVPRETKQRAPDKEGAHRTDIL